MTATHYKELDTDDTDWQREAARLAHTRTPFVLNGFSISLDSQFCEALKEKYNFDAVLDDATARVYFNPRASV